MSDETMDDVVEAPMDERTRLRQRADLMGIKYSPNIGNEALAKKIEERLAGSSQAAEAAVDEPVAPAVDPRSPRQICYDEAMKLVRVRITNLVPKKKDLHGELITVGNDIIGHVTKFVPFGEVTDNGWHLPQCIYDTIKEKKFNQIKVRKENGREVVQNAWVNEYALEVLPMLTKAELEQLARAQAAAENA